MEATALHDAVQAPEPPLPLPAPHPPLPSPPQQRAPAEATGVVWRSTATDTAKEG